MGILNSHWRGPGRPALKIVSEKNRHALQDWVTQGICVTPVTSKSTFITQRESSINPPSGASGAIPGSMVQSFHIHSARNPPPRNPSLTEHSAPRAHYQIPYIAKTLRHLPRETGIYSMMYSEIMNLMQKTTTVAKLQDAAPLVGKRAAPRTVAVMFKDCIVLVPKQYENAILQEY